MTAERNSTCGRVVVDGKMHKITRTALKDVTYVWNWLEKLDMDIRYTFWQISKFLEDSMAFVLELPGL